MSRNLLPFLLFLSFENCNEKSPGQHGINKDEQAAAEQEIRQMLDEYFAAIKSLGLEGEFFLDSSASFYWVPPGYSSRPDYGAVATILRNRAPAFCEIDFGWSDLHMEIMSRRIANYSGRVRGSMTDTAGQIRPVHLIETGVIVKRDDGWKLLCGQSRELDQ